MPGLGGLTRLITPTAGDGETVNRAGLRAEEEGLFSNIHGAGFRGVFDLSDPAGAWVVIATGQSGHPLSRFYDDLGVLWRRGEYIPMSLDTGLAKAAAVGITRLEPR